MRCPFYQIDAFTGRAFSGNPAAVMLLEEWLPDEVLQAVAAENNLSETAFFRKMAQEAFELRWFTPTTEVPLCGHATLAAGFVVMTEIAPTLEEVSFETLSGRLHVRRRKDMFVLDFPAETPSPSEPPRAIVDALGRDPVEACSGSNHLLVYRHESDVLALEPDMAGLAAALEGNGKGCDRHGAAIVGRRRCRVTLFRACPWHTRRSRDGFGPLHDRSLLVPPPGADRNSCRTGFASWR